MFRRMFKGTRSQRLLAWFMVGVFTFIIAMLLVVPAVAAAVGAITGS